MPAINPRENSRLVLAPTGKAVDVAVREGAGDHGYTIAKALQLVRDNQLRLNRQTLVVVEEYARWRAAAASFDDGIGEARNRVVAVDLSLDAGLEL
jgi:hypothetical protein